MIVIPYLKIDVYDQVDLASVYDFIEIFQPHTKI